MLLPDARQPEFTGQGVWRYNFPRGRGSMHCAAYKGPIGVGLVPIGAELMYMYVTTPEPGNPRYPREGLAQAMRDKLKPSAATHRRTRRRHHRRCGRGLPAARVALPRRTLAQGPGGAARRCRARHHAALGARRRHGDRGRHRAGRGTGAAGHAASGLHRLARRAASSAAATSSISSKLIGHGQLGKGRRSDQSAAGASMFEMIARPI